MWFLLDSIRRQIEQAYVDGVQFSAADRVSFEAAAAELGKVQIVGNAAVIPIEGILTEKRDFYAAYYGGGNTLYPDIIQAIAQANGDPNITEIRLEVGHSPGGNILGMVGAMDAVAQSVKPVVAYVKHGALSAAYGLVSQAGQIVAGSRATQFGSIGVAYDTSVYPTDVSIASTEAPNKRPDLTTEEGKEIVRSQLDAMHALFVDSVASGRNTDVETVNKMYGRGSLILAGAALAVGMIDEIAEIETTATGGSTKAKSMDLEKLKAEFPALYAQVIALGVAKERDRASAHLVLGEASGDMKTAVEAVTAGDDMTETIRAKYLAAGMNKNDINARQSENPETEGLATPATSEGDTMDSLVARELDSIWGSEGEGVENE